MGGGTKLCGNKSQEAPEVIRVGGHIESGHLWQRHRNFVHCEVV